MINMIVKRRLKDKELDLNNLTYHIGERRNRLESYFKIKDVGKVYDKFIVDKGHQNGDEIHVITDTGFILIFNFNTKKFITILHARPGQLKRYYTEFGEVIPSKIRMMATSNENLNNKLNMNNY